MSLGPLMIDIEATELTAEDREILQHPLVGGVILFTRNYADIKQLTALTNSIHALRTPPLLIAVDHEGGRVQRFRGEFTELPPARLMGIVHRTKPQEANRLAELTAWLMAVELRAVGVDFSFAPVLDVDYGISTVIGDRAFDRNPAITAELGRAWWLGVRRAGMIAVGKHFPGHGAVAADSHQTLPVDHRVLEEIRDHDLQPFARLIRARIPAIMMAHIVYDHVDRLPASFSDFWIREELRTRLEFQGAVFCDDLVMHGAATMGDYTERATLALQAGCEMLPVCNSRHAASTILDTLGDYSNPAAQVRLAQLHGGHCFDWQALQANAEWRQARSTVMRHYQSDTLLH